MYLMLLSSKGTCRYFLVLGVLMLSFVHIEVFAQETATPTEYPTATPSATRTPFPFNPDLNGDSYVDEADLFLLRLAWHQYVGDSTPTATPTETPIPTPTFTPSATKTPTRSPDSDIDLNACFPGRQLDRFRRE